MNEYLNFHYELELRLKTIKNQILEQLSESRDQVNKIKLSSKNLKFNDIKNTYASKIKSFNFETNCFLEKTEQIENKVK